MAVSENSTFVAPATTEEAVPAWLCVCVALLVSASVLAVATSLAVAAGIALASSLAVPSAGALVLAAATVAAASATASRFSTSRSTSTSVLMRALSRASSMKCACESNRIVLPSGLTCAKNPSGV